MRFKSTLLLVINTILFTSNVLIAKLAADTIPPFTLAFFRWFTALLIFIPFRGKAFLRNKSGIKREWKNFLVLGFLGMFVCGGLPFWAAHTTSANNIALIYASSPIFIVLLEKFFYRIKTTIVQVLGIGLALLGVALIVFEGTTSNIINLSFTFGDILMVLSAISWAIYSLRLRHVKSTFDREEKFIGNMLAGTITLFPMFLVELSYDYSFTINMIWFFLALGLFPSLLAFLLYQYVQDNYSSSTASLVFYMVPPVNAISAYIFLNENLYWYHLIGGLIIILGVILANKKRR